jgi:pimeloyl-ACP methyl ester carboxylesterase
MPFQKSSELQEDYHLLTERINTRNRPAFRTLTFSGRSWYIQLKGETSVPTNFRRFSAAISWLLIAVCSCLAGAGHAAAQTPSAGFVVNTNGCIVLPDGRRLAYAEFGDPNASQIIIHHHGIPSCRLDGETFIEPLKCRPGVRLYVLDRPGIGASDPYCCKSFLNWPADVNCFVDALKIDKFAVMGASGGTPYALAVARAMPERVTVVSIACPMAPLEAVGYKTGSGALGAMLADRHPVLSRAMLGYFANAERRRPNRMPLLAKVSAAPDHNLLRDPAERQFLAHIVDEAFRQGPAQMSREAALLTEPWDCWLPEVRTHVNIYSGCEDRIAPPVMARYLASRLPDAQLTLFPGEAHLSLGRLRAVEFLDGAIVSKPVATSTPPAPSNVSRR